MPEYIHIGKIAATHGLKGELVLKHALGKKTNLKNLKTLFVKDKTGSLLPWFLEAAKIKSETETYIQLEEVATVEAARSLVQKEVWLTEEAFQQFASKQAAISLLGFRIFDKEKEIGEIEEIIEQPHQVLCKLTIEGKEVLIPLHEDTLLKVDSKSKKVYVELPDGLLDIYLT
ncbi:MAG: 16S rRNA processing protein RimM [Niabella sp.]|nr:MAG: 16S rRNA processing protein RimM [Niabella sp.]